MSTTIHSPIEADELAGFQDLRDRCQETRRHGEILLELRARAGDANRVLGRYAYHRGVGELNEELVIDLLISLFAWCDRMGLLLDDLVEHAAARFAPLADPVGTQEEP